MAERAAGRLELFEADTFPSPLCCRWVDCRPLGRAVYGEARDLGGCVNRSIQCLTCGRTGEESRKKTAAP